MRNYEHPPHPKSQFKSQRASHDSSHHVGRQRRRRQDGLSLDFPYDPQPLAVGLGIFDSATHGQMGFAP